MQLYLSKSNYRIVKLCTLNPTLITTDASA
jgi:hypothetical protein